MKLTRRRFMKLAATSAAAMSLGLQFGCNGGGDTDPLEFAVVSDVHLYASSLGTTGSAFETYLTHQPKMLREGEAILKSVVDSIMSSSARFVLMPGDMTKDGERACHELMASYLAQLKAAGKMVYVVPGNRDVLNPGAFSYSGSTKTPIPNVTAAEFAAIYGEYGYDAAIARDPSSLSYVAEPADGYWLLALDSCIYENNATASAFVAGEFSAPTLAWIDARLAEARQNGKIVIGLMHHALTEHFTGESIFSPGSVINDWADVSKALAQGGMQFVFTGHCHASDITARSWSDTDARLYDIGTDCLTAYPCSYRQVSIDNDAMNIDTTRITAIDYDTGLQTFQQYALDFAQTGLVNMFGLLLMSSPFNLTLAQAQQYAPLFMPAQLAQYAGDEAPDSSAIAAYQALLADPDPALVLLGQYLSGLWTDLAPPDNTGDFPMS